jgi:hypothetical protein
LTGFRGALRWQLLILVFAAALVLPAGAHATPTFLTAINISDPGRDAFEPKVVIAPSGTVIAIWTRSDGTNFRIQSSSRTANGDWSAPQTVSDPGASASGPAIAVDPSGNAVAAWTQSDGTNLRINSAYRPAAGSFSASTTVSAAGADASAPSVSMDNSGNALVAWARTDGTNLRVQSAIRTTGAGGSFGGITTLSDPGQDAFEPQAAAGPAVDANGTVVWTRSDGTNLRVQSARRRDVVGFPRPKGATPLRASLVPAFKSCASPGNRVHGPSLAFASCTPPVQASSVLTIGSPDANSTPANFVGSLRWTVIVGNANTEANEADVKLTVGLSDVRNTTSLTDYTGNLTAQADMQITDMSNAPEAPEPGTMQSIKYQAPVSCVATGSTSVGSNCAVDTTANALVPGTVLEGRRTIWQFGQMEIKDPGPDTILGNGDDTIFLRQGVFVP